MESLGRLLAKSGVTWTRPEKTRVRAWLRELETNWFLELDDVPAQHLAHLLRGLRLVSSNADRLRPKGDGDG